MHSRVSPLSSLARHPTRSARWSLLSLWSLHRQRSRLADLDADRLDDLGLARIEAVAEAARPVWDVPAHWRR